MKFIQSKYEGCLLNLSNTVLKTSDIKNLPSFVRNIVFSNFYDMTDERLLSTIQKGTFKYKQNGINDISESVFQVSSNYGVSYFSPNLIKPFLQKGSKFYLAKDCNPVLIVNKNYCVLVAPHSRIPDEFIQEVNN